MRLSACAGVVKKKKICETALVSSQGLSNILRWRRLSQQRGHDRQQPTCAGDLRTHRTVSDTAVQGAHSSLNLLNAYASTCAPKFVYLHSLILLLLNSIRQFTSANSPGTIRRLKGTCWNLSSVMFLL